MKAEKGLAVPDESLESSEVMSEKHQRGASKTDTGFCSSFKSKRYRDKLRSEIKSLDSLLPVDRTVLHRKLDSQTVFSLVISFFRTKVFFKSVGFLENESLDRTVSTCKAENRCVEPPADSDTPVQDIEQLLKGDNLLQALDGFLVVAMADGTIMYVSDTVLQHLGYNQIDLMHRCLYSVVHPDDHYDVRDVFEQTIPSNGFLDVQADSFCDQMSPNKGRTEAISFLCRMRCFNATTAGYLKMHCSGRIQVLDGIPKTSKCPNQIIFAFCRPFMISGQDLEYDVKQNVFWTKHDMDLAFKQLDKKAADVIGYVTDDVDGESFYKYIHPEDITTCCVCHKALIESNEIQTMYFRIQAKSGAWVWLHSRGKVVTKNSKKYSIVFSHYPVREDDSSYIQQEVVLRQRYAINELFCLRQNNFHLDSLASSDCMFEMISQQSSAKRVSNRSLPSPCASFMEELVTSQGSCPSSWHAMSDRHSPVLPSTHVAHKISLREKQIHFQDFKKRQVEQSCHQRKSYPCAFNGQLSGHYPESAVSAVQGMPTEGHVFCGPFNQQPPVQSCRSAFYNCAAPSRIFPTYPEGYVTPELSPQSVSDQYRTECYHPAVPPYPPKPIPAAEVNMCVPYGMPPSPPPSPQQQQLHQQHFHQQQCVAQDRTVHVRNVFTHHPTGGYTWVQDQTYHVRSHGNHNVKYGGGHDHSQDDTLFQNPTQTSRCSKKKKHRSQHKATQPPNHCRYNTQIPASASFSERQTSNRMNKQYTNEHQHPSSLAQHQEQSNLVTWDIPDAYSCAVASGCCEPGEKTPSCFDPAFHMKIVDEPKDIPSKSDIDLPSIGSFLEYLNDIYVTNQTKQTTKILHFGYSGHYL